MTEQLELTLAASPQTERRIDITLKRIADVVEKMSDAEREHLATTVWWTATDTIAQLRSMERAEEDVTGHPALDSAADIYDRIITPGEHPLDAMCKVLAEMGRTFAP